jgi:hypothetical protein
MISYHHNRIGCAYNRVQTPMEGKQEQRDYFFKNLPFLDSTPVS